MEARMKEKQAQHDVRGPLRQRTGKVQYFGDRLAAALVADCLQFNESLSGCVSMFSHCQSKHQLCD